jgi:hypothetical protein
MINSRKNKFEKQIEERKTFNTMGNIMRDKQPLKVENPHLIKAKNYDRRNLLKSMRDERIELGIIPVSMGNYKKTSCRFCA